MWAAIEKQMVIWMFLSAYYILWVLYWENDTASNSTHTLDQYIHDYIRAELCMKNNASRLKDSINVPNFTLHHAYLWFTIDSHWVSKEEEREKSFRTTGGVQLQCLASTDRNVLNKRSYCIRSTCADCCPMTLQSALLFHFNFFLELFKLDWTVYH